jgi:hypothetical protein
MANTFIFDDEDQPDMGSPEPDQGDDDQAPEEGEGNNRTFIMLLIGIGGFALIAIICIITYFALSRPGGPLAKVDTAATDIAVTQQALAALQTQEAQASPLPTLALTETPTATQVVLIVPDTETPSEPSPTIDPDAATLAAVQTQGAKSQITATFIAKSTSGAVGTGTVTRTPKIPQTGFADEVGLPALVIVTFILLAVILLARRLRAAPER